MFFIHNGMDISFWEPFSLNGGIIDITLYQFQVDNMILVCIAK